MATTTTNNVVINKLSVEQYREIKGTAQEKENEVYNLKDVDEYLGVQVQDITGKDLNTLTGEFIVGYGNNCTNKPSSQNGYLINIPHAINPNDYDKQLWFIRHIGDLYLRNKEAGTWGSWIKIAQEPNIMTAYSGVSTTVSVANASKYVNFTLSNFSSTGSKLTISNGGIKIGSSVSKIKVSAQSQVVPTGGAGIKHIRIYRNSTIVGWACKRFTSASENDTLVIPPRVYSVSEGDIIYLKYYGLSGDMFSGGNEMQTVMTVEVVN